MTKLTEFEKQMIKLISKYLPYTEKMVKIIYVDVKSWDKTIYILTKSVQLNVFPHELYPDYIL